MSSSKPIALGLVIGLTIGLAVGYIIMEQKVSQLGTQISNLESRIADRDLLINQFLFSVIEQRDTTPLAEENVIVYTMFTLDDLDEHKDFFADLMTDETIEVELHVMGSPVNLFINNGTFDLMQKADTLSGDFTWTVPADGRYAFRVELDGEYALLILRISRGGGTMMSGGSAGQEKVAIESVQVNNSTSITLWAKSTGGGNVTITEVILRDLHGNQRGAPATVSYVLPADGTLVGVTATVPTLTLGDVYTAALVSKVGNQFVSTSFKVS